MQKRKTPLDRLANLTWNDLDEWVSPRILDRGRSYRKQGRVSDLVIADEHDLLASVRGTIEYATWVVVDDDGPPSSVCTCPYELDCKHGVAVVLEYLNHTENDLPVPRVRQGDPRLDLFEDESRESEPGIDKASTRPASSPDVNTLLKGRTKAQLIELVVELAGQFPEIARILEDRWHAATGNTEALVARARDEISAAAYEPDWHDRWDNRAEMPDYSKVRNKFEALLAAECADEVLDLGGELLESGRHQVEMYNADGVIGSEIAGCVPLIIKALKQSSRDPAERLAWAVDAIIEDDYGLCSDLAGYLNGRHRKADWGRLADILLERLDPMESSVETELVSGRHARDQMCDYTIHALEQAGRHAEIIPLCEVEARLTGSYCRLVDRLIDARLYEEAERWVRDGILAVQEKWPGIARRLHEQLVAVRTRQKDWHSVTGLQAIAFIHNSSTTAYSACRKAAEKADVWPAVRKSILTYLEHGTLPWQQRGWPLPATGMDSRVKPRRNDYPMYRELIDIAIFEKEPDRVLRWYDKCLAAEPRWYELNEEKIAKAVKDHAPDRAVAVWKHMAERESAQVKPKAYRAAAVYLRQARDVLISRKQRREWNRYLQSLRDEHKRKYRLIEILDRLAGKSIIRGL